MNDVLNIQKALSEKDSPPIFWNLIVTQLQAIALWGKKAINKICVQFHLVVSDLQVQHPPLNLRGLGSKHGVNLIQIMKPKKATFPLTLYTGSQWNSLLI